MQCELFGGRRDLRCLFPLKQRSAWHMAMVLEISEVKVTSSRGRHIVRGVRQKMSTYQLRPKMPCPTQPRRVEVTLVKSKLANTC